MSGFFAESTGGEAGDYHRERCKALGLAGYRLHDARHHWAVEHIRAGVPVELVARQLGHRDGQMVLKVYGRFVPRESEWDYWRKRVEERQAKQVAEETADPGEKSAGLGTKGGTEKNSLTGIEQ